MQPLTYDTYPLGYDVPAMLQEMAEGLRVRLGESGQTRPLMVGIHTGGVWVAEHLHRLLELPDPLGHINIAFYRDDFSQIGLHPHVTPSALPFDIQDRHIILVDDVLHTGRTIRAALNELFDYGRPAGVTLAVLVDRDGRELPIQADVVGLRLTLPLQRQVKLTGPEPLDLRMQY